MRTDSGLLSQQAGEQADVNIAWLSGACCRGQVMAELIKNDRVIGGMTPVCSARAASALYKIFLRANALSPTLAHRGDAQTDGKIAP